MSRQRFSLNTFLRDDRGAATAEYAIATMAAVGFAGLLVVILRGDEVREILTDMVRRALTFGG
jgi:Flp pilus assembly pilin Flp